MPHQVFRGVGVDFANLTGPGSLLVGTGVNFPNLIGPGGLHHR